MAEAVAGAAAEAFPPRQEGDRAAAVSAAEALGGPVNPLVNNAGIVGFGAITDMALEAFERVIDINFVGAFLGMKHAAPSMKRAGGGAIINISSAAGMVGYANTSAYVDRGALLGPLAPIEKPD